jgi:putative oxidoreductase
MGPSLRGPALKNILLMKFLPRCTDTGLLVLRIFVGAPLFLRHGIEKIFGFSDMAQHFPDPIGIGPTASLACAFLADVICSTFLVIGFATRWAALIIFTNLFVAWAFLHKFMFLAKEAGHGELIVVYMGAMLTLLACGAGKYSVDNWLDS